MRYWDNGHMDGGTGVAMMLVMLGVWVLVIVAVIWIVWTLRSPHPVETPRLAGAGTTDNAYRILAERLARGDIDAAEYQSLLDVLNAPR